MLPIKVLPRPCSPEVSRKSSSLPLSASTGSRYFLACSCKSESHAGVSYSATPWAVACLAPLSMGFSRQEYWSGLPFPSPGSSWPRDRTWVSCIVGRFLTNWASREVPYSQYLGQKPVSQPKTLPISSCFFGGRGRHLACGMGSWSPTREWACAPRIWKQS